MKNASFGHLLFSSRTSRWFYVFWALIFVLYILLDTQGIFPESISGWILPVIVAFPVGVYANIAYGSYRLTPDFFFTQDLKSSKQYKWEDFEGYEVHQNSIFKQIITAVPPESLVLSFSGDEGKVITEVVHNTDTQLASVLDARHS